MLGQRHRLRTINNPTFAQRLVLGSQVQEHLSLEHLYVFGLNSLLLMLLQCIINVTRDDLETAMSLTINVLTCCVLQHQQSIIVTFTIGHTFKLPVTKIIIPARLCYALRNICFRQKYQK